MKETQTHFEDNTIPPCRVFSWERLETPILEVKREKPREVPSALEKLMELVRAKNEEEIGENGPSYAATSLHQEGVPTPDYLKLFETLFGRDSLRVASDMLPYYPALARTTLRSLAELQGIEYDQHQEEEPGRIPHEIRNPDDPIAKRLSDELEWDWPYYGEVDATPAFVCLIGVYDQQLDDYRFLDETYRDIRGNECTMYDAFNRAVLWMEKKIQSNPEGLIEFCSVLPHGIKNQVWKDAWDVYHHCDGTMANHQKGIASVEVQAVTYDALLAAAHIYKERNEIERAETLLEYASKLKVMVLEKFWNENKGGYFVIGTDRDERGRLRQLDIRTSNMGHLLNSRILEGDDPEVIAKRTAIVRQLFSPELLCAGGIRTLASDEIRFRPGSYQCGSSWPWDTHYIAKGLRKYGYTAKADDLDSRVLAIVEATHMFPEYVRGDQDLEIRTNTRTVSVWDTMNHCESKLEQPPQEVQAWTVTAVLDIQKMRRAHRLLQEYELAEVAELALV